MKKVLMDISEEGGVIADRKNKGYGCTKEQLLQAIDLNSTKNQVIIFNGKLEKMIKLLNDYGFENKKDYHVEVNYKLEVTSITLKHRKTNNIHFKPFEVFFYRTFNEDLDENIKLMFEDIKDFESVSGLKNGQTSRNLDALVRNKIKSLVDGEKNYSYKLDKKMFIYLQNGVQGAFRFINHEEVNKIIKVTEYDVNSYYQWIGENKPMPVGNPIVRHKPNEECEEKHLTLLRCVFNGKLKENKIPILKKKQINFDFNSEEEAIYELDEEEVFCTGEKYEMISEFYDIYNCVIKDGICFEKYSGDGGHEVNKIFHNIRENIKNKELKKHIKLFENKFIGTQTSKKMLNLSSFYVNEVDNEGNIEFGVSKLHREFVPYAPLYLFITDYGRNRISSYVQQLMPHVIASNTDSITIKNTISKEEVEKILEVDQHKLGAFKIEGEEEYGGYISPTHYIRSNSLDKIGDIVKYKGSGVKNIKTEKVTFEEAVKELQEVGKEIIERN